MAWGYKDNWQNVCEPDVLTVVVPLQQNSLLLSMPYKIHENIFYFFSYEELAQLRLVCLGFAKICSDLLHLAFQKLGPVLDRCVLRLCSSASITYKGCLICKALYLAIAEHRFVRAVCWRHLQKATFNFFAGRLLDLFYHIVRLSYYDQEDDIPKTAYVEEKNRCFKDLVSNNVLDELSYMVENFIKFFEINIEPDLDPSPTQTGIKIIDLLDCFLGSNCDVDLTYDNKNCTLHGRYFCPLSGVLYSVSDNKPAEKYLSTETEATIWLSDLRELARKSNQRYIATIVKELSYKNTKEHRKRSVRPLFYSKQRCRGRIRGSDGKTVRENYEKDLEVSHEPSKQTLGIKTIVRVQFPLWQWPLELDQVLSSMKKAYEIPYENEDDLSIGDYFDDLVNWAYPCTIPDGDKRAPSEDGKKMLWFQFEVCRQTPEDDGPYLRETLDKRIKLSFMPTRLRQVNSSHVFNRSSTIVIRDACLSYEDDKRMQVILGRVAKVPECEVIPCAGSIGAKLFPNCI